MAGAVNAWGRKVRLREVGDPPLRLHLEAGEAERAAIAAELDVLAILRLEADLAIRPWLDGAEISGKLSATVTYECGVTLDPFDAEIDEPLLVRVVRQDAQAADGLRLLGALRVRTRERGPRRRFR